MDFGKDLFQSLKQWIPYLLIWLANAAWLAYFYTIGGYESYEVEVVKEPLTLMRNLFYHRRSDMEGRILYLGAGACADFKSNHRSHQSCDFGVDLWLIYSYPFLFQKT